MKQEIETNWLNDNKNYFIFLEHRMAHHYQFVKQNCGDAFSFFTMEKNESYKLINKLRQEGTTLTQNEALLAMKLDFINLFEAFEEIIKNSYPDYLKLLNLSFDTEQPLKIKPILLKYGSHNIEVVKILYEALCPQYITESLASFASHFNNTEKTFPKIKWKGKKLTVLYAIFNDGKLKHTKKPLPGLNMQNYPIHDTIANHFCKANGEDLKLDSIRIEMIGQTKGETVPGLDDLMPTLMKINSYKNR